MILVASSCSSGMVENDLVGALNDLQLAFPAVGGPPATGNTIASALANDITDDQIMADVAMLDFDTATDIAVATGSPGSLARLPNGDDMVAADTLPGITRLPGYNAVTNPSPGFAGDVVLIGDLDWMDDTSFMGYVTENGYYWPDWPADNENLLLNIIGF